MGLVNHQINSQIPEPKVGQFMIGVGCIMEHQPSGTILVLQRDRANFQKGEWELMYGRIDNHEELLTALARELFEETSITQYKVKRLLRLWHFYRGEKTAETEIYGYTFHCVTESMEVKLSPEHSSYDWVSPEEALEKIKIVGVREDIRFFMENKNTSKVALSGVSNVISTVFT